MRLRRRLAFAAPFVLVVACTRPIASPVGPDEDDDDDGGLDQRVVTPPRDAPLAEVAESAIDSPIEAPIDAPIDPPIDAPIRLAHERHPDAPADADRPCRDPRCAPRRSTRPCEPPSTCNPPAQLRARIHGVSLRADGVELVVSMGSAAGISKTWRGCVIDDAARCVQGGEVTIINVTSRTTKLKARLSVDQVRANPNVELAP